MLSNCKGNVVNRMNLEQYKGVFIYAQQVDNKIDAIALELLGKANDLAADLRTDVTAVLIGSDVKGLVDELAEYGADKVIVVDDPLLNALTGHIQCNVNDPILTPVRGQNSKFNGGQRCTRISVCHVS